MYYLLGPAFNLSRGRGCHQVGHVLQCSSILPAVFLLFSTFEQNMQGTLDMWNPTCPLNENEIFILRMSEMRTTTVMSSCPIRSRKYDNIEFQPFSTVINNYLSHWKGCWHSHPAFRPLPWAPTETLDCTDKSSREGVGDRRVYPPRAHSFGQSA